MKVNKKEKLEKIKVDDASVDVLKRKHIVVRIIIFFLVIVMLAGIYTIYKWNSYQNEASSEAIALANSLKVLMPEEDISELTGSIEDLKKPEYSSIKNDLAQLVETTNPIRFAYLMAERDENIVILMDSESTESSDYSPPGQVYEEANDIFREPFRTGETVLTKPITDRWGTWISILVPVKDITTDNIVAVFGIDYSVSDWYAQIWEHMIPDIIIVVFFIMLSFALLYSWAQYTKNKSLSQKLAYDEALYHSVFDQAPIGIAIVHDKNFVYQSSFGHTNINPMFEQILGRTSGDLVNINWPEITHAEDLQADLKKFDQFKKGEINGYTMEKRFIKPDGSIVWTHMTVTPLLGVYDDHSTHLCLIKDIINQKAAEAALIESEKKYRSITENMSDVVWQMDLNLKTTYVSPSVEKLLGESIKEHMNRKMEEKFPAQTLHKIQSIFCEELEKEKDPQIDKNRSRTIEVEHYKADGTVIWLELNVSFIRDNNGNAIGFQGSSRDITQRKLTEIALRENERRESVLLSHLPGLAYRCKYNRDGTMLIVSNGCYALTGYLPECFINDRDFPFNNIIRPEYREILWAEWERTIPARRPYKCEYEITTATGERKWALELGQGIYNDDGEVEALEGIILDISDRKEMENHLRYINEHDKWTGLYNRDHLEALLNNEIKKRDGLKRAVISINLSTVQLLTANYGFHYTQNLIKMTAETLSQHCSDTRLLFQTYENRFVFYLIDYKDKNELVEFSDVIAEALEALLVTERIGGGIGIFEIEQDDDEIDVDLLLRRLLIASERSIAVSEKDFEACFYNEELEAEINREGDIRKAIAGLAVENSNDELFLQYQPIMDLKTNSVCGFEALARLKTEKLGLVSPGEFIPIAEKTKLINPVGEKVIKDAFRFLNRLKENGYDINISINVSSIQLLRPGFAESLFETIKEMQVSSKNFSIEITESVFADNYDEINAIITKLKGSGIHISIDDFGTGYSSLARVKELNVSCLKIDKYFIDKLMVIDSEITITGDIISMAHRMGHCVIAEGVEHEEQKQYLLAHGCDKIQGYLVGRPLDEDAAFELLARQKSFDNSCHLDDRHC